MELTYWKIRGLCLLGTLFGVIQPARSQRIWFDGTVDTSAEPPGKLLSDNADYWGEVILAGVDYRYPHREPDSPPDNRPDREGRLRRTLMNGNRGQRRNVGVVAAAAVREDEALMMMTANGMIIRSPVDQLRVIGRNTQGVRLVNLDAGDSLLEVIVVPSEPTPEAVEAQAAAEAEANGKGDGPTGGADGDEAAPPQDA